MSAVRMDGKALSAKVRGSILAETEALKKQGVTPGLAVIIVGNDPASEIYVRNKERACEQCGFYSEKYALPEETTQEELLGLIAQLNESPAISGILCQMPVPKHISEQAVIDAIDPKKDVDAFHPSMSARSWLAILISCRARPRCHGAARRVQDRPEGKGVRRSRPLEYRRQADEHAAAAPSRHGYHLPQPHAGSRRGVPPCGYSGSRCRQGRLYYAGYVKEGAVVIDVGINRNARARFAAMWRRRLWKRPLT